MTSRRHRSYQKVRKSSNLKQLPTVLIVCEGEKTEPNYFRALTQKLRISAAVHICGIGCNTISLVKKTEQINESGEFGRVWCVFDRDDFSLDNYIGAIRMAREKGFKVAYSAQAFEIWYNLHFSYLDSAMHRRNLCKRLTKYLGRKYEKNDSSTFDIFYELTDVAIRNAKKLRDSYGYSESIIKGDPYTEVDLLVVDLRKLTK